MAVQKAQADVLLHRLHYALPGWESAHSSSAHYGVRGLPGSLGPGVEGGAGDKVFAGSRKNGRRSEPLAKRGGGACF